MCLQYDSRHHHHARPLWFDPESGGELLSLYGLQCLGTCQPPLPFSYWLHHLVLTVTPPLQLLTASPCSDSHPSPSVTNCITLFWQPPLPSPSVTNCITLFWQSPLPFSYWLHHLVLTATPPLQLLTASPCSDSHPSPSLQLLTASPCSDSHPTPSVTDCITLFWQPPLPFSY